MAGFGGAVVAAGFVVAVGLAGTAVGAAVGFGAAVEVGFVGVVAVGFGADVAVDAGAAGVLVLLAGAVACGVLVGFALTVGVAELGEQAEPNSTSAININTKRIAASFVIHRPHLQLQKAPFIKAPLAIPTIRPALPSPAKEADDGLTWCYNSG